MITFFDVAYICNDLDNALNYKVIDNKAYYKDELIFSDMKETYTNDIRDISVIVVKPVEYVEIKMNIKV